MITFTYWRSAELEIQPDGFMDLPPLTHKGAGTTLVRTSAGRKLTDANLVSLFTKAASAFGYVHTLQRVLKTHRK